MKNRITLVLGNGKSRLKVPILTSINSYGCNALYRDMEVDYLVSVDVKMQHEIYTSGYACDHICYFPEWSTYTKEEYDVIKVDPFYANIIENQRHTEFCNMAGSGETLYVTWLYEHDKVVSIKSRNMSSGTTALDIAASTHDIIFMAGFDIEKNDNVYQNSPLYENSQPSLNWYKEHLSIYNKYRHKNFIYVECDMTLPKLSNVTYYTVEQYLAFIEGEI